MLDDFETDWQPPVPGRHTWWAPTILGMLVVSGACGGPREPEVPAAHGVAQHAPAPRAEEGEGEGGLAAASDAETTPNHTAKDTANVEPAPVDADREATWKRAVAWSDEFYLRAWGQQAPESERRARRVQFDCVWDGLGAQGVAPAPELDCFITFARAMESCLDRKIAADCTSAGNRACTPSPRYVAEAKRCKELHAQGSASH